MKRNWSFLLMVGFLLTLGLVATFLGSESGPLISTLDQAALPAVQAAEETAPIQVPSATATATPTPNPAAVETFTIKGIETFPEEKKVVITFSDTVDMDNLRNQAETTPYANLEWWSSSAEGQVLHLVGSFEYDKDYDINFYPSTKSSNGRTYIETLKQFRMPDRPQQVEFTENKALIEKNSRQLLHLDVVNVDQIRFEGVQVPPMLLPLARSLIESTTGNSLQTVFDSLKSEYLRVSEALSGTPEFAPFLREPAIDTNLFFTTVQKNIKTPYSVPLSFRKDPARGTIELLSFWNGSDQGTGQTEARIYRITDLGMAYKVSQGQLLVWVTSLDQGLPVPDVAVMAFDQDLNAYFLGKTSEEGVLVVKDSDTAIAATIGEGAESISIDRTTPPIGRITSLVAATPDDVNSIDFEIKDSVKIAGIEQAASRTLAADTKLGNLFTERGVYRPGETVHWKGTVRRYADGSIVPPAEATCEIEIKDSNDESVYLEDLAYSEFGTISDQLDIESFASLGTYTLFLRPSSGKPETAKRTFQVQEFRPPRHFAEVQFQQETRPAKGFVNRDRTEQILVAKISSRYFAGGPLQNAKVRWRVATTPTSFPQSSYPTFTFGFPISGEGELIESSESILDESGQVEVRIPLGKSVLTSKYGLSFSATVVDFDGRTASKTSDFSVRPEYLVGLSSHPESVPFGDPQVLRAIVLDASGAPIQSGQLQIAVKEKSYIYTRKRNQEGNVYASWDSVWSDQYETSTPLENGEGVFKFSLNQSGEYLVQCSYRDGDGLDYTSATVYRVDGPWYWGDEVEPASFQPVQILPDKLEYEVGENIRLLVNSGHSPVSCLLTIEREGVLEHRLVRIDNGEIVVPVGEEFRPNVYITLLGILPRGDFPTYREEFDSEAPAFVYGALSVKVRNEVGSLDIELAPDEKELRAQPGDRKTWDLVVRDENGNPSQAEVAVAVVDEQVLALTGYTTPSLANLLDFKLPLSVFTGETRQAIQNQTPYDEILNRPITGGGGMGAGIAIGIQLREDFDPVAYFNPALVTDADGRATFEFEFPDSMTTYRVFAVACDRGGRFGTAERSALVVKDFYLEPGVPRFFTRGDRFEFNLSLFNHTDRSGQVDLEIQTSEHLSLQLSTPAVTLPANDQIQVPVKGEALRSGKAQLVVSGRFGEMEDGVRLEIPVEAGLVIHKDIRYGTMTTLADIDVGLPEGTEDLPWGEVKPEDFGGTVTLSGSPFLKMEPSLRYLLEYPYGCIEQTSSGVLPLAALRSIIEKGLVPGIKVSEVDPFLQKGIDRIFGMQTESGGFSYWPGLRTPNAWGSLYALTALLFAQEAGLQVPEEPFARALQYLESQLDQSQGGDIHQNDIDYRSMAKYLLAKAHHLNEPNTATLDADFDRGDREGRFLTLLTAKALDLWTSEDLQTRMTSLIGRTAPAFVPSYFNAVYREKAIELLTTQALQADGLIQKRIADQLFGAVKPEGRWTSTSDTGWALLALGKYLGTQVPSDREINGNLSVAGGPVKPFRFKPASAETFTLDAKTLTEKSRIRIDSDSVMPLTYQLSLTYPRLDFAKQGYSNGFKVSKTLENVGNSETLRVGDVVKVTIRFEATGEGSLSHLAIDDPLPAGLVAINGALATEEPVGETAQNEDDYYGYWDEQGYYRLVPNYFEMRDTKVVAFRDRIWSGPYQYVYYARAVCAGSFRLPPTKVHLMYTPEVCGYTPESQVVIEAQ